MKCYIYECAQICAIDDDAHAESLYEICIETMNLSSNKNIENIRNTFVSDELAKIKKTCSFSKNICISLFDASIEKEFSHYPIV